MWLFPMAFQLGCSNVTNGALLKTLGPWDGLYVVSSLIRVYMQLLCGQRKGTFWGLFRQLMELTAPFPRTMHVLLKKKSCINVCWFCPLSSFLIRAGAAVQGPLVYYKGANQVQYQVLTTRFLVRGVCKYKRLELDPDILHTTRFSCP